MTVNRVMVEKHAAFKLSVAFSFSVKDIFAPQTIDGLDILLFLFISQTLIHMSLVVSTLRYMGSWLKQSH